MHNPLEEEVVIKAPLLTGGFRRVVLIAETRKRVTMWVRPLRGDSVASSTTCSFISQRVKVAFNIRSSGLLI